MKASDSSTRASTETRLVGFDERTRRVLELRELVRRGEYRIDPAEVAAAILDEWRAAAGESELPSPAADDRSRFIVPPTDQASRQTERGTVRSA